MTIDDVKKIFKLRKEKKFDEIYNLYGQDVYLRATPLTYQSANIDKLLSEGKYFALYEKYGEDIYDVYMKKMQKADIENELGVGFHFVNFLFFEKCKSKLKVLRNVGLKLALFTSVVGGTLCSVGSDIVEDNAVIYESEINDYNKEIEKYGEYINSLGLSDLEIIIKVINDMWSTIDGYYTPGEYDVMGYERLALYMEGFGVCRSMADDFTARMNAINPDYEACNLLVYINDVEVNEIDRNILIQSDTVNPDIEENKTEVFVNKVLTNTIGNHMVSCITLKNENIILVVDPTNPSIGVLKNGQIHMLSNSVSDGLDVKPLGHIIYGVDSVGNYTEKILESYATSGDIDILQEKYGIDSQNETLEQIVSKYGTEDYGIKR